MNIQRRLTERTQKRVANSCAPSEAEWAKAQPIRWRYACLAFAIASNTRGGVVGKSEAQIVREANAQGVPLTLRTFKRRVAVLQAYGIVYMDEKRAVQVDHGRFQQPGSTWIIRLDARMPDDVPLTSSARWHRKTMAEWFANPVIRGYPVKVAPSWTESPAETIPFLYI
jgi:hypothetical protein